MSTDSITIEKNRRLRPPRQRWTLISNQLTFWLLIGGLFSWLVIHGPFEATAAPPTNTTNLSQSNTDTSAFDFDHWKKQYGNAIDIKQWNRLNPLPWGNYFSRDNPKCADREGHDLLGLEGTKSYKLKAQRGFVLGGSRCRFLVSSGDQWESVVHEVRLLDPSHRLLVPRITVEGGSIQGKTAALKDFDSKTSVQFKQNTKNEKMIIRFDLTMPEKVSSLDVAGKRQDQFFTVEAKVDGQWQACGWGRLNHRFHRINPTTSKQFRMVIDIGSKNQLAFTELKLHAAPKEMK